jgi:Asp-tRNA(Asn)/Glu-tRNA(Gln) amidotransferase A subunit family amidase
VRDIFDIAGVKPTLSSRAYSELYGPQQKRADYVEKLLCMGAIVVGKTKTTSFASSDEPTD